MKNLKKVLLALVVVAMLVSSVVTIAIANGSESYTGSVEEAQELYNVVLEADVLAAQSEALVAFYAYIDANPIDPAAEGYDALIEAYNLKTSTVALGLYGAYLDAQSTDTLKAVFTHLAAAPSLDGEVEIDGVKYTDLVKEVNFASVQYADELLDALFATVTSGDVNYYDYLAAQQALTKFFNELKTLSYVEYNPNPDVYTGNILALNALVKKIRANAKFAELKAGLAEVYSYMRATPVNPASDEFAAFLTTYNEKCNSLIDAFKAELGGATSAAEQIATLKSMREYLTATPLTENVVAAFNAELALVVDEYNKFANNFKDDAKLADELADIDEIVLGTDLTELTALIAAFDTAADLEAKLDAFKATYDYLAANDLDPATEGYADLVVEYNTQKDELVAAFADGVTKSTNTTEKLKYLKDMGNFLAAYPVSEAAIAEYEALKDEVVELFTSFSKALKQLVLPTYTAPAPAYVSTNVAKLDTMCGAIAGDLDAQKAAMTAMYTYLLAAKIDTAENGYDAFVAKYNEKRAALTTALFATIDAAETPEAELAAFEAVKAYLVATPYSYDAVVSFNAKVAAAYEATEDEATREALTIGNEYIYFALAEALDFFDDATDPTVDEVIAATKAIYAYSLRNYDVTESPIYKDDITFQASIAATLEMMGEAFVYYAENGMLNTRIEDVALVCDLFAKTPISEDAINDLAENVLFNIQKFASDASDVAETYPKPSYIYNELNALVSTFNRAEGLDARMDAFKALYAAKAEVEATLLTAVQAGDAEFRAAYAVVCTEMASEIVASIVANAEAAPTVQLASFNKAFDFLTEYIFSQAAVDGYNAKLETVKTIDFAAVATTILTECPVLVYTSPETTESDFTELKTYIDAAASSDDALVAAYDRLGGKYKKAKPVDFAKNDFVSIIETLQAAKTAATDRYTAAVDSAELTAKPAAIDAMYKFVKKSMLSSAMVAAYNTKCDDVVSAYTAALNTVYDPYVQAIANIHSLLDACAVDTALLSDAQLALFNDVELRIDALEYAEIFGQILRFKTASGFGKYDLVVQNQMIDAMSTYLKTYEVAKSYNEYALANSLFTDAAEDLLITYSAMIDMQAKDDDERAAMIAELAKFIEDKVYCQIMVDLYNSIFASGEGVEKLTYNAATIIPDEAIGTLADFSTFMKAYFGVQLNNAENATASDYEKYLDDKEAALIALFEYMSECPLGAKSPLSELNDAVASARAELEALTDAQKQKLDAQAPENEYEYGIGHNYNFENDVMIALANSADCLKKSAILTETLPDGTQNKYMYVETTSGTSMYSQSLTVPNKNMPTIFEMDLRLVDGFAPMYFDLRPVGTSSTISGSNYMLNPFNRTGDFSMLRTYDPSCPSNVRVNLVAGEWTHVIVKLDPINFKMTVWIDYVEIGSRDLFHNNTTTPFTPSQLRLNFQTANSAIELDNLIAYSGTSYREHGKFDGMSDGDKFKYYVDFFSEESYEPVSRAMAYNKAAAMVDNYRGVAGYEAYVENFDLCDYNTIIPADAKKAALETLVTMMNESGANNVTTANYTAVETNLAAIETYMVDNAYYLDQASPEYNDVKAKIVSGYAEIVRVQQLLNLIDTLDLFARATTVTGMTKRANAVATEYEKCNFAEIENYEKAAADPKIVAFLAAIGEDITLDMYYNEVMPQRIANRATYENSGKIILSVNKLKALVENANDLSYDAFLEALMAAAKENFDYTNAYMTVIRNIIKSGDFDATYDGLADAISIFDYLDGFFYQLVVEAQVEAIKGQLDRYSLTTSYIDKLGVCTYVRKYIDENNVDVENALIAPYFTMLLAFEDELKSYEAEYESILDANTTSFIALVERMSAFVEYKDIKPLYEEALNNYFYNMNQDSEAAKAAMATFDAYAVIIKATEENSKLFVAAAAQLSKATKTNAIYKALVECAAYVDGVDSSIEGVADALAIYNTKLAAYNAKINPVNAEIEGTASVVYSVRTVSIDATVLATIKKIISK